jgi:hypothetical protein
MRCFISRLTYAVVKVLAELMNEPSILFTMMEKEEAGVRST